MSPATMADLPRINVHGLWVLVESLELAANDQDCCASAHGCGQSRTQPSARSSGLLHERRDNEAAQV